MFKNRSGESQRQRFPQPLIKSRIASGRGAMEQPNVTSDDAPLTPKFWVALCLTGVATGLLALHSCGFYDFLSAWPLIIIQVVTAQL